MGSLFDPELLPGAVEAAERIVRAIRDDRRIVIYGDYDVDGATAALYRSADGQKLYDKWFMQKLPPKGLNLNAPISA